jgi:hypothetical protein
MLNPTDFQAARRWSRLSGKPLPRDLHAGAPAARDSQFMWKRQDQCLFLLSRAAQLQHPDNGPVNAYVHDPIGVQDHPGSAHAAKQHVQGRPLTGEAVVGELAQVDARGRVVRDPRPGARLSAAVHPHDVKAAIAPAVGQKVSRSAPVAVTPIGWGAVG